MTDRRLIEALERAGGVPREINTARLWLLRVLQAVPQKSAAHREATKLFKRIEDQFL